MAEERKYIKRRRVPRREFRRKVGLLIGGKYNVNLASQIGEGGMMIFSHQPLEIDQQIVIAFRLPESDETVVRATVRYFAEEVTAHGKCYGVEFDNLEFRVRRLIRTYVASKSEDEYFRVG